jgi:hypothetical protein
VIQLTIFLSVQFPFYFHNRNAGSKISALNLAVVRRTIQVFFCVWVTYTTSLSRLPVRRSSFFLAELICIIGRSFILTNEFLWILVYVSGDELPIDPSSSLALTYLVFSIFKMLQHLFVFHHQQPTPF